MSKQFVSRTLPGVCASASDPSALPWGGLWCFWLTDRCPCPSPTSGHWLVKLGLWSLCNVLPFFLPPGVVGAYSWLARFGSPFFLLIQMIILLVGSMCKGGGCAWKVCYCSSGGWTTAWGRLAGLLFACCRFVGLADHVPSGVAGCSALPLTSPLVPAIATAGCDPELERRLGGGWGGGWPILPRPAGRHAGRLCRSAAAAAAAAAAAPGHRSCCVAH